MAAREKSGPPMTASQHAQEWRPHRYRVVRSLRTQSRRERGRFAREHLRSRDRLTTPMQPVRRQADRYETRMAYESGVMCSALSHSPEVPRLVAPVGLAFERQPPKTA
jgi:hypothetical protein